SFAGGVLVDGAADLLVSGQARGRAAGFRCDRGGPLRLCGAGGSGLCPPGPGGDVGAGGQRAPDRLLHHTDLSPAFGHLVEEFGTEGPLDHPLQVRVGLDHGADGAVGPDSDWTPAISGSSSIAREISGSLRSEAVTAFVISRYSSSEVEEAMGISTTARAQPWERLPTRRSSPLRTCHSLPVRSRA